VAQIQVPQQAAKAKQLPQPEEPIPPEDVQADQAIQESKSRAGAGAPKAAPQRAAPKQPAPNYRVTFSGEYFPSGTFGQDVADYRKYAVRKTGYAGLDAIQPLYPGIYVLGAIPSLGKTTFVHQMADQIATDGECVLYFSLEQSRFELYSKSIARCFFQTQHEGNITYPTPSSIEIRRGTPSADYPDKLADQIARYAKTVGDRMAVIDGAFSITVEDIEKVATQCITTVKRKPVVVVDYLQIVAPSMDISGRRQLDARESVDHIVHKLKELQSNYNLTVIIISSLNRQNYLTPIDFESFKESGGIEYTADVIWGLQLGVMSNELFARDGKIKEKRDMVRKSKVANPRSIDFICLKNRYGPSSYTAKFLYYPASDMFTSIM